MEQLIEITASHKLAHLVGKEIRASVNGYRVDALINKISLSEYSIEVEFSHKPVNFHNCDGDWTKTNSKGSIRFFKPMNVGNMKLDGVDFLELPEVLETCDTEMRKNMSEDALAFYGIK